MISKTIKKAENAIDDRNIRIEEICIIFISSLEAYIKKKTLAVNANIEAIMKISKIRIEGSGPGNQDKSSMLSAIIANVPKVVQKMPEIIKEFPKFCLFLIPKRINDNPKVISKIKFGIR